MSLPSVSEPSAVSLPSDPEDHAEEHPGEDHVSLPSASEDTSAMEVDKINLSLPCAIASGPLARRATGEDDIVEVYSPPRVVPVANSLGLKGDRSLDLKTGVDFMLEQDRDLSIRLLQIHKVHFLMLSPPCTSFSPIHKLFNKKVMMSETGKKKWDKAMIMLKHSMDCARVQVMNKRLFVFEHPWRATSWTQNCVMDIMGLPGVHKVVFDQCCFGAVTKITKTPVRKRTQLMTNSSAVVALFDKQFCKRDHQHTHLEGVEGGERRTKHAEVYPPELCQALAQCALKECTR